MKVGLIVDLMRRNPAGVRFADLEKVCRHFFGEPRHDKTSHIKFRTPWQGEPYVNIQNLAWQAKPYQVRQVLAAIDRLADDRD